MNDPDIMKAIDNIDEAIIEEHLKKKSAISIKEKVKSEPGLDVLAVYEKIPNFPKDAVLMSVFSKELKRLGVSTKTSIVTEFYTSKGNIYRVFNEKRDIDFDMEVMDRMKAAADTHVLRVKQTIDGISYTVPWQYCQKLMEIDSRNKDTVNVERVVYISTIEKELGIAKANQ